MITLLLIGSGLGALVGFFHAWQVYTGRMKIGLAVARNRAWAVRRRALYAAVWTWVLWTAFGSYLFILWLFAIAIYLPYLAVTTIPSSDGRA